MITWAITTLAGLMSAVLIMLIIILFVMGNWGTMLWVGVALGLNYVSSQMAIQSVPSWGSVVF
jgi:hypothetical protein